MTAESYTVGRPRQPYRSARRRHRRWAGESIQHGLAAVVDGWRERDAAAEAHWHLPCTAALVRARKRVGARLLRLLFHAPRLTQPSRPLVPSPTVMSKGVWGLDRAVD